MNHALVAIYDKKLEAYLRLFTTPTLAAAERTFREECKNPQSQLSRNPEDFRLDTFGLFNDATGAIHINATSTVLEATDAIKQGA